MDTAGVPSTNRSNNTMREHETAAMDVEAPPETATLQEESERAPKELTPHLPPREGLDAEADAVSSHEASNHKESSEEKSLASMKDVFSFGSGPKKRVCLVLGILCSVCAGLVFPAVAFVFASSFQVRTLCVASLFQDLANKYVVLIVVSPPDSFLSAPRCFYIQRRLSRSNTAAVLHLHDLGGSFFCIHDGKLNLYRNSCR